MDMKKNDILRYCAGGAFLFQALSQLVGGLYLGNVIGLIINALIGVSFFIKKPVLATVGGAVWILMSAIELIELLSYGVFAMFIEDGRYWWPVMQILFLAADILFFVLTITRKKQLGYAAAVICGIGYLGNVLLLHSSPTVGMILTVAGYVLAGLAYGDMPTKVKKTVSAVVYNSAADKIQRLENLQNLLEKGIITQEEFDAKKHQLLNL